MTRSLTALLRGVLALAALAAALPALAQSCGIPGRDGPGSLSGVVNTYYPPSGASVNIGPLTGSVALGTARGAAATPAAGDLFVIIQMQCADINSTDTSSYGDGAAGDPAQGYSDPGGSCLAGRYQFVRAGPATTAASLDLTATPLTATYVQAAASGTQGRRSFQIVRVLQHSSATLTGAVTASAWDGATGGVVVLDVAGALNWSGQSINVTGLGFRGAGGRNRPLNDGALTNPYRTTDASGRHAVKGEGIAGTPQFVHNDTGPTDTAPGTVVDLGAQGYPNGDYGRGAPGNGGGGGASISNNSRDNGGGGGGGNGAAGGYGAYGWRSAGWGASYTGIDDLRGTGGGAFLGASSARLVMGGGGGAGDNNNNGPQANSSGAAGGGIVMVRAGSITGTGTIGADGARAPDQANNDAAGGGGAGGSVLVISQAAGVGTLTVNVRGGRGGDSFLTGNVAHGGGGGGGGGVAYASGAATTNVGGGSNGNTNTTDNPPGGAAHGAASGSSGVQGTVTASGDTTGAIAGARCLPQLTVTKQTVTAGPISVRPGQQVTYRIVVSNAAGRGNAQSLAISDVLPADSQPVSFRNNSATPAVTLGGGATRPSTSNAAVGATSPAWSSFDIPGGGSVTLEFTVIVPANIAQQTYQNPATATYLDPARTTAGGTTTTSYDPASSTLEDVTVLAPTLGTTLGTGCPAGFAPGGTNLVTNSDFSAATGSVGSSVTLQARNTFPPDTSVAIQDGAKSYSSNQLEQSTFPGDPTNGVPAANSWLLGNGDNVANYRPWRQTVSGLTVGVTYIVSAYVSNAEAPGQTLAADPVVRLLAGTTAIFGPTTLAGETFAQGDQWVRIQGTFVATAATQQLDVRDDAPGTAGDFLAATQIRVQACVATGTVGGFVYRDANANGSRDGGESWSAGTSVTVKLTTRSGTTCNSPAIAQQTVAAGTGAYNFGAIGAGDYCIVLDNNATASDVTPNPPAGWFNTNPSPGLWRISVGATAAISHDFGLLDASFVSGRVFRDTGAGGGTANDGVQNGGETGIANITVALTNCAATTYATTQTGAGGDYSFAVPSGATTLCVVETNEGDHRSTGASVGTTALPSGTPTSVGGTSYTYSRGTDTISFTAGSGTSYAGLNFGDVPDNSFSTNGQQSAAPGTTLYYPHTFIAGSAGTVTFSPAGAATPNVPGWSEVVHNDSNCNGRFDAGEPLITAGVALTAGQQLCILVKEFVPANAPVGGENIVTVTATFAYANANPALNAAAARIDLTIVSRAGLTLVKSVSAASALPGAVITYTITYSNPSTEALTSVVIRDATPVFTTYVSASCGSPPAGLTCTPPASPATAPAAGATGAITWNFGGTLAPGASSAVTFQVQVNN
jgi:uncharacterized repeat protein (TIGR01451 family)